MLVRQRLLVLTALACGMHAGGVWVFGADYDIKQVADETMMNREATVNADGLVAWAAAPRDNSQNPDIHIMIYRDDQVINLTESLPQKWQFNSKPLFYGNRLYWTGSLQSYRADGGGRSKKKPNGTNETEEVEAEPEEPVTWILRDPPPTPIEANGFETNDLDVVATNIPKITTGDSEILAWSNDELKRITRDAYSDAAPAASGNIVAWQKARGWPFGWEIMMFDGTMRQQLTTNYYYDMAPSVDGQKVVWYGWDGNDFEIYMYDHETRKIEQITNNTYDDVSPSISGNKIAWEAYAAAEADIFLWEDGESRKISRNIDDDIRPMVWGDRVVWQGFDGEDWEIFMYNGQIDVRLTSNTFDDEEPFFRDDIVCWVGYHDHWDSEVFMWDGADLTRLTDNDYDDRSPRTSGGYITWYGVDDRKSYIYMATPK